MKEGATRFLWRLLRFEVRRNLLLCQLFVADLGPALVVELVVVAHGGFDLVEGFTLGDEFFDLSAACFCVGDSLLDVGFGLDVAVAGMKVSASRETIPLAVVIQPSVDPFFSSWMRG